MTFEVDTRTININTVVSVAGFLATFVFIGIAWGASQAALSDLEEWRIQHEGVHRDLQASVRSHDAVVDSQISTIRANLAKLDQIEYRMAILEKADENTDVRIGRITESYSNQFSDFRTQLSSISTQIALTNQTLQRIEAATPAAVNR
ncbi:hypothetical protein CN135_25825 [Sinorhizobium meliloti]|uniref:hypothetical protein n=1 Tax=Rhizobium meliloti TaxID=382 RepID=UPI000FDC3AA0|nr:hypothetical protein [Sinorhizobium meliloti]RVL74859.1 hypothetical protein CN135_25825 [Sinorhizobium meliloti]